MTFLILALGVFLAVMNWATVYAVYVHDSTASIVPLFGGILLMVGWANLPYEPLNRYWPAGMFIDFGCVPMFVLWGWRKLQGRS